MSDFQLVTRFEPAGDQPEAIRQMIEGIEAGLSHQTLLGVTGSGKTFSIANVIAHVVVVRRTEQGARGGVVLEPVW